MSFDIVFCLGPNDISKINKAVDCAKTNVIGFRNIYIISYYNIEVDGCIVVDENIFPFIKEVANIHGIRKRNGWYVQQLLKLYAGIVIPGILNSYLVIDSDTFFLRPVSFIENGIYLLNPGTEYHEPYFVHMEKIHKSLKKVSRYSGISHHMIFDTSLIKEIFALTPEPFWKVFLENVTEYDGSGASEYEIYFTYLSIYHPEKFRIRSLKWKNSVSLDYDYDYVSLHWYLLGVNG